MRPISRRHTLRGALISLLAGAMLLACTTTPATPTTGNSPSASTIQPTATTAVANPSNNATALTELKIDSADFSFSGPESIPAGWVKVTLTNSGKEPHHAQLLRLNDGVTVDEFQAAMKEGEDKVFQKATLQGGPSMIVPGGKSEVVLNLQAGQYFLLCFLPSHDGMPHVAKGMVKPFSVTGTDGATSAAPATQGTIVLSDFSFEMPDTLSAGHVALEVTNQGQQPHEITILRLAEGKTAKDVQAYMANPDGQPPFLPIGGMQGLGPKGSGIVVLDLEPGNYYAICMIPDPGSHKAHLELGMGKEFTVK